MSRRETEEKRGLFLGYLGSPAFELAAPALSPMYSSGYCMRTKQSDSSHSEYKAMMEEGSTANSPAR